jgi:hypothetical protein
VTEENALKWVRHWTLVTGGEKNIVVDVTRRAVTCSDRVTLSQVACAVYGALEECPLGDLTPVPMGKRRLVEVSS